MSTYKDLLEVGIEVMASSSIESIQSTGRLHAWKSQVGEPLIASELMLRESRVGLEKIHIWLSSDLIERAEFTVIEEQGESVVTLGEQALYSAEDIEIDYFDEFILRSFRAHLDKARTKNCN